MGKNKENLYKTKVKEDGQKGYLVFDIGNEMQELRLSGSQVRFIELSVRILNI